jgi:2,5-furandicarboxylate decarboxylase 1
MGNLMCSKETFADYLGIPVQSIIPTLIHAIDAHSPPRVTTAAPCQDVIHQDPDLDHLPILFHCEGDGGNYISSGVLIAGHPQLWSKHGFPPLYAIFQDRNGCAGG